MSRWVKRVEVAAPSMPNPGIKSKFPKRFKIAPAKTILEAKGALPIPFRKVRKIEAKE